ncbi:MAG: Fic family protein [Candidatus Muirbacterium halophilum]|nr:Fic family protein [Candidatus Muirbacterium halophilum]MCK9476504.1 Fic family protein [Candidatus Muirbacterium halophilum]
MKYNLNFHSKYYYQNTQILKNKFNIKNYDRLIEIESDFTCLRLAELYVKPINGKFDIKHFLNIHKYIFQDVYDFAGKIRFEEISKGNTHFCKTVFIMENLNVIFGFLKNLNIFSNMPLPVFIENSAYFLSELNMIHPFIEGNGRAIREFFRCICEYNNLEINWQYADKDTILEAFIGSARENNDKLKLLLDKIINIGVGP